VKQKTITITAEEVKGRSVFSLKQNPNNNTKNSSRKLGGDRCFEGCRGTARGPLSQDIQNSIQFYFSAFGFQTFLSPSTQTQGVDKQVNVLVSGKQ
jgi:hypothetical protein